MKDKNAGLPDIPGVVGPIEEPYDRQRKIMYDDREILVPKFEILSRMNPSPFLVKLNYYCFDMWVDMARGFFDKIRVVKPRRYYHRKFRRVPEIWECDTSDRMCRYEAESQFRRDLMVDEQILDILEERVKMCDLVEGINAYNACVDHRNKFEKARYAFHVKYGDLGIRANAVNALNKHKNRVIEERFLARTKSSTESSV